VVDMTLVTFPENPEDGTRPLLADMSVGRKWRRVLLTLTGPGCAAVAEDLGGHPARFVSVLWDGFDVVERRYSSEEAVACGHARAMLGEQSRRVRGAA
jgi:hypothetical protein